METDARITGNPRRPAWALVAFACLATLVAAYLAELAWNQRGLPLGCGDDGGCAEVLRSRWSAVWGVPVSALAMVVYAAVAVAALRPDGRMSPGILSFAAVAMTLAAVWFLLIQGAFLRAFCVWCVVEHGLSLALAALAIRQAMAWSRVDSRQMGRGSLLGCVAALLLMSAQAVQRSPDTTIRLDDAAPATTDEQSALILLDGHLRVVPQQEPRLGDATAEHTVCIMFDYCCPHCRRMHGYLLNAMAAYPRQISVVCLPVPRDADCNEALTETEARFEHACELARLALAVWHVDPSAFADFDRWLFASPQPREFDAAWQHAREIVAPELLKRAYADPVVAQTVKRNVTAFNRSKVGYLPVILSRGMDTIVGRPTSQAALLEVLQADLLDGQAQAVTDEPP